MYIHGKHKINIIIRNSDVINRKQFGNIVSSDKVCMKRGFKVIKVIQNGHMQKRLIVKYGASARYIFTTIQENITIQKRCTGMSALELH